MPDTTAYAVIKTGGKQYRVAGHDVHHAAAAARGELDRAGGAGEERVVLAHADAVAGLEARAALANDDLAARHLLAGEDLDAEHLRVGVAPVARGAEALLVRHDSPYLEFEILVTWMRVSSWRCPVRFL